MRVKPKKEKKEKKVKYVYRLRNTQDVLDRYNDDASEEWHKENDTKEEKGIAKQQRWNRSVPWSEYEEIVKKMNKKDKKKK